MTPQERLLMELYDMAEKADEALENSWVELESVVNMRILTGLKTVLSAVQSIQDRVQRTLGTERFIQLCNEDLDAALEEKMENKPKPKGDDLVEQNVVDERTATQNLMANSRLTFKQVDILLHALGHPKYYRNYFAVDMQSRDWGDIQTLAAAGLMELYTARDKDSGLRYYRVSETGKERMRAAGFTLVPPENEHGEGADYAHD